MIVLVSPTMIPDDCLLSFSERREESRTRPCDAKPSSISYSHDLRRIRGAASSDFVGGRRRRTRSLPCSPRARLAAWCEEQLRPENAKFVLVICTPTYRDRVENKVSADEGRGVFWEGSLIYQYIYDEKGQQAFHSGLARRRARRRASRSRCNGYARLSLKAFDLSDSGFDGALSRADRPAGCDQARPRSASRSSGRGRLRTPNVAAPLPRCPS